MVPISAGACMPRYYERVKTEIGDVLVFLLSSTLCSQRKGKQSVVMGHRLVAFRFICRGTANALTDEKMPDRFVDFTGIYRLLQ